MTKSTYTQLQQQIAELTSQAEELRKAETAEVIGKIRDAIGIYGLSAADLFGGSAARKILGPRNSKVPKSSAKPGASAKSKSKNGTAKFADGQGGEWVGRGPRPLWLRTALASGRRLEEFAVKG